MIQEITADQLQGILDSGAKLVDVREAEELAIGTIAGYQHMPLSTFGSFETAVKESGDIVFYCAGGVRSLNACQQAEEWTGPDTKFYSLAGGYNGYAAGQS